MEEKEVVSKNFIELAIDKDLAEGVYDHVCTRFPPEPNGYLHIGHAKSILLNYGLSQEYNGEFHMRFDDTNPTKEKTEFVDSIKADIQWLGADWKDHLYYASDYFPQMYEAAVKLIKKGKAFVCDLSAEEIREYRGTLTEPGKESPYRNRSVEENLDLFERMKNGEFEDGSKVLRASTVTGRTVLESNGTKQFFNATGTIGHFAFTAILKLPLLNSSSWFPFLLLVPSGNRMTFLPSFTTSAASLITCIDCRRFSRSINSAWMHAKTCFKNGICSTSFLATTVKVHEHAPAIASTSYSPW